MTVRYRKSRYCHVMYKLLYPSIRVRNRVGVSFSFSGKLTLLTVGLLNLRIIDTEPIDYSHYNHQKSIIFYVFDTVR